MIARLSFFNTFKQQNYGYFLVFCFFVYLELFPFTIFPVIKGRLLDDFSGISRVLPVYARGQYCFVQGHMYVTLRRQEPFHQYILIGPTCPTSQPQIHRGPTPFKKRFRKEYVHNYNDSNSLLTLGGGDKPRGRGMSKKTWDTCGCIFPPFVYWDSVVNSCVRQKEFLNRENSSWNYREAEKMSLVAPENVPCSFCTWKVYHNVSVFLIHPCILVS